jgi:Domain of unknown function (DUF4124)
MKRIVLCAALLAWSAMASAVVYKWVDTQGKVQYGDRPPDGVHAEVVELLGTHPAHAKAPSETPTAAAAAKSVPSERSAKEAKEAVDADVAQTREKQCAEAQDRYQKLIERRRLYKTGAEGERQYLTSEEIDSERLNAKRDVDVICNGPS